MEKKALGSVRRSFAPWTDPDAPGFIEFVDVTKKFGEFTAVADLSLTIYEREFFALLGPSGCGKTTMMRMVAGFEEPTSGRVLLDGQDLAGVPPYHRPVNMMFQSYALFPHMSVAKNIGFGLKQDGMAKSEISDRVQDMLKLVKLEPFASRKPHQLSGGQRQRVALARSLAKRPKVLLLDEPLGALDRKLREETQFELTDLQQELGLTFMIVTHDQEEAMTVADRIAVMDHGEIIQIGTPTEIYEEPSSRYVADFIGDINMVEGSVAERTSGAITIEAQGIDAPIVVAQDGGVNVGDTVWFAIRPEKMSLSLEEPKDVKTNRLTGAVWDIAYLGDISIYHVHLESGQTIRVSITNSTRMVERPITWNDQVWMTWTDDAGVVLDR